MTIKAECNSCGKILTAKDSAAGKRARCPQCGGIVNIPEAAYEAEEYDSFDDGYDDYDDGFDNYQSEGPSQEKRKSCPACGEMIVNGATKCRFCGEIFDAALKRKAKKKNRKASRSYVGDDEDLTTGDWLVAILCSGIGCIAGIIWMIQGKPKGSKMFGISILMAFFWGAIRVFLKQMGRQ